LVAPVPAGTWHLSAAGFVTEAVDVHFELIHRKDATDDSLCTWDHHFDPAPDGTFPAMPFEADASCAAVPGDLLVLRYSGQSAANNEAYIPDGEGSGGNDLNLTLP
jgi:hypothetical protein